MASGNPASRLDGRVAFISGGLSGIGRACAERFLQEGASVVIGDLVSGGDSKVAGVLRELGEKASYLRADAASEADWASVCESLAQRHGMLHVLVNNAGIDQTGPLSDLSGEEWDRLLRINATSAYLGTRTLLPLLRAGGAAGDGGASVINVSSIMGLVGQAEAAAYCASKGAVRMFTKAVAVEFAAAGYPVRVNSLHPGCVETPLLARGIDRWIDQGFAEDRAALEAMLVARAPMGRLGRPAEIAAAAAFLASADSSFMTGAELVIDGGWTAQ